MNWEIFYFVCFLVGFLLSLVTFLAGSVHLHTPRGFHFHGTHGHAAGHHGANRGSQISWFNFGTITAFLAWFGGTGYLLTRYSNIWALLGLGISGLSGIGGAALVFWFVFKFLLAHEQDLDPADYNMIGVLGQVSSGIREGGTGEMIFSQQGVRRCAAARSEDGKQIAKGAEVVVIRYEKAIAYVRLWEELNSLNAADPLTPDTGQDRSHRAIGRGQSETVN
jgi:membrane protein implicated in regulation of membrane protease activity